MIPLALCVMTQLVVFGVFRMSQLVVLITCVFGMSQLVVLITCVFGTSQLKNVNTGQTLPVILSTSGEVRE